MGFMKIFIPLVPQLHWGLFMGNSYGVAHSENGESLYLNDIELQIKDEVAHFHIFTFSNFPIFTFSIGNPEGHINPNLCKIHFVESDKDSNIG